MKQTGIFVVQFVGGWILAMWPVWRNTYDTWVGMLSTIIGMVVLLYTLRKQFISYKIKKIELKDKLKNIEIDELRDMLKTIEKEKDNK